MQVSDTGAGLEVGSFMFKFSRFGDMDPYMDTGAGICLKIIKISKNRAIKPRAIKPRLWNIMWRTWGAFSKEINGERVT